MKKSVSVRGVRAKYKAVSLTAAVLGVKVFIDGVQRILLFAAVFPGSQDIPDTLVQESILALQHTHTHTVSKSV